MDNTYFYEGELGYFVFSLLPLLELYTEKFNKVINISTLTYFKNLLDIYFKDSSLINVVKTYDIFSSNRCCNKDKNMSISKNNKLLYNFLVKKLNINESNDSHGYYHKLKKKFIMTPNNQKKYICIFPQIRKWHTEHGRNFSKEFWISIIKIFTNFNYKIVAVGSKKERLNLENDIIHSDGSIQDDIKYLNNCDLFISPHSGYANMAQCCNINNIVILSRYDITKNSKKQQSNYHKLCYDITHYNQPNIFLILGEKVIICTPPPSNKKLSDEWKNYTDSLLLTKLKINIPLILNGNINNDKRINII